MKNILFTLALLVSFSSCEQTPDAVYNNILQGLEKGFRQSAITGFNERAISKMNLKDYNGAIADYTKAIELNPNYALAYYNRGISKKDLEDNYGAIADYNKAIELDPNYTSAYVNRGISKENLGDLNGACADWKKSINLGSTESVKWVANQCN